MHAATRRDILSFIFEKNLYQHRSGLALIAAASIGDGACTLGWISYAIMPGLVVVSLSLALGASMELRFYVSKVQLRNIERVQEDVKNRRE